MAKKASKPLNDKQEQFCLEYIIDFNATQAAIRAGYSKKTAQMQASRLLLNVMIQERIAELIKERQSRTQTKADDAMNECIRIALADVGQAFNGDNTLKDIHEMPEDIRRAISGIEIDEIYAGRGESRKLIGYTKKVKFWSKDKQIETLFKHHGLFERDNDQSKPEHVIQIVMFGDIKKQKEDSQEESGLRDK